MEYFYIQSKTVKLVSGLRFRYFDLNYVSGREKKKTISKRNHCHWPFPSPPHHRISRQTAHTNSSTEGNIWYFREKHTDQIKSLRNQFTKVLGRQGYSRIYKNLVSKCLILNEHQRKSGPNSVNSFENTCKWWLLSVLSEERAPLACQKKHNLSTGGKDNNVNTSASIKQSSLNPGKAAGNSQVKYFGSSVEQTHDVITVSLSTAGVDGQWLAAVTAWEPTASSGRVQQEPAMALPGQNEGPALAQQPKCSLETQPCRSRAPKLGCPQHAEIWVAAQTPVLCNSHHQTPQQNSMCASDFNLSAFHSSGEQKSLGEMELLLPRKSRLGTDRPWRGIRDVKQECVSIWPGITLILYCSFWT